MAGHDPERGLIGATDRQAVWSRHWAQGQLHSCASSFGGELGPGAQSFWQPQISALTAGARVVDLASGNGVLTRLVWQLRRPLDVSVDAVDLAVLAPQWLAELSDGERARLPFHAQTRIEALPFADHSIDVLFSQYGLEYAEAEPAARSLRRVARPGATLALVVHHAGSLPVRLARQELLHLEALLAAGGLLDIATPMLGFMAQAATAEGRARLSVDANAAAVRERFNAVQDALDQATEHSICPDVLHESRRCVHQALGLAAQGGLVQAQTQLQQWRQALQDAQLRLQELVACARDAEGLAAWLRVLGVGDAAIATLQERGELMGWTVQARY